ncbi:MAG: imidazoleglycerol-phosphate dehydratase [Methanomassiliicoccales archaeon]|nr:imidazoleglycerol-phosphate dehydratase [Methanomassiliicoccales archaeon]
MKKRMAKLSRKTRETDVEISMVLDGSGTSQIECEDQFLRHMIETFGKYASFDLTMKLVGDNKHHLVEDAAIVLGLALRQAIGDVPVERISSATVPMDDALVSVAVDLIDRPYADIECPNDLYRHFLRSFAMASGITLHVIVQRGFDEHHIIEAIFKALGLALKNAVLRRKDVLSTKEIPRIGRG